MKRTGLIAILGSFAFAIACGGSPSVGGGDDDDDNGSDGEDSSANDGGANADDDDPNATNGDDDILNGDDDIGPGSCATATTCEEQGTNCGFIANGCGGVVDCGTCEANAVCGLTTANVCQAVTEEEFCMELSEEDACAGKACGQEGDGCGGVYDCGTCAEGEGCGLVEAFQCAPIITGTPDECDAEILTCAEVGVECGVAGNGCGGTIDCDAETGGCAAGEFCGGAGPQQCGTPECVPLDPAVACAGKCGVVSNGCGVEVDNGIIDCSAIAEFACPAGTACGASGVPNVCGDASEICQPIAAADACGTRECGVMSDGCESSHTCGTCDPGFLCREGVCDPLCVPVLQADACAGKDCGIVSDGCSGSYTCGTCEVGERCGLTEAFMCDVIPPAVCTPRTPAEACAGRECGEAFDGCGSEPANIIDCAALNGGCPNGEFCGVIEPFQCDIPGGDPMCTAAASCAELGWECGIAFDACGNMFDCADENRTCAVDETCIGGIEAPAECVSAIDGPSTGACDVCDSIPDCSANPQLTRIAGRVITPGRTDGETDNQVGVPNAFVYIMRNNDPTELPAIGTGIPNGGESCDRCDEQDLGPVLASATTDALGGYIIEGNIPVGEQFVLVVKIGKWRRAVQMTLAANAACATTNVSTLNTRLPRSMADGLGANIPRTGIVTGEIDAMECVLFKMGVAEAEFAVGQAAGTARMHLYGRNGAEIGAVNTNPVEDELLEDDARMRGYDMVVLDCQGANMDSDADEWPDPTDSNIRQYVNRGGRMFASHWSFRAIHDNVGTLPFAAGTRYETGLSSAANWDDDADSFNSGTAIVSLGRPRANDAKIQNFADWLVNEGVTTAPNYTFAITDPRDIATSVNVGTDEFVYRSLGGNATSVQQFAFNTPFTAPEEEVCGRVAYSAFHVAVGPFRDVGPGPDQKVSFPDHCTDDEANDGILTNQEKSLLFMLFDLGACVSEEPPEPPECSPLDCTGRCGIVSDGCGGIVDCSCTGAGEVCNQSTGMCEVPQCTPSTCEAQNAECGFVANGCGGTLDCAPCPSGEVCDISTNTCEPVCTPITVAVACADSCGFVSDGCGDVIECPDCAGALSCIVGQCGDETCTPLVCPPALECGVVSDGCDGVAECGECVPPETCGGGGVANMCGIPECNPLDCDGQDADCGWVGDGCGSAIDCGPCPMGQACGAGGPNKCDGCEPRTCDDAGAECGAIGDGCGSIVECGPCPVGEVCGAFEANQCGDGPGCTPLDCDAQDAECGEVGDGCGGVVDCGPCPVGEVCGFETPFQCDPPPPCVPTTCEDADAECGEVGDGCGGRLSCGVCPPNHTCILNQCERNGGAR